MYNRFSPRQVTGRQAHPPRYITVGTQMLCDYIQPLVSLLSNLEQV